MQKLVIEGKNKLYGTVKIGGMKNSALPIIYATLLIRDECILENIPFVSDIINSLEILKGMGASVELCENNTVRINTRDVTSDVKDLELISKMRASCYLMGTMLSRFGRVKIPMPGGCNFGARPIDQHLKGFECLGANCNQKDETIENTECFRASK